MDLKVTVVFNLFHQVIYTDVALDPYNSDGHDGIVREDGEIFNIWDVALFFIYIKKSVKVLLKKCLKNLEEVNLRRQ